MWTDAGSKEFEQAPVGTEVGVCIKVIDIGTQTGEYQGQATSRRQVIVSWELPNSLMADGDQAGKPFVVSRFYTASLNEKATLRHHLVSWRGREFTDEELAGFNPRNIIGKPCLLSLVANTRGKTVVSSVMALPKGMPVHPQKNPSTYFSMWPGQFDQNVFDSLSDGIKTKFIIPSPEYQAIINGVNKRVDTGSFDDMEDDITF